MKLRFLAVATLAAMTLTAGLASAQDTTSEKGKLSYALGYQLGREAIESGEALDVNTMVKALQDGYAKRDPVVSVEDMRNAYQAMQQRMTAKAKAAYDKAAAENKTRSDSFLAQYKATAGVRSLANGVLYKVMENGNGAKPTPASTVELEVAGPFPWGQMPQQAQAPQKMPGTKLSEIEMAAIRNALMQMPAGSKWEIALPPEQAFGADPRSPFPPNVAVVFQVRLVSVK
ncbi:MAG TPA: FKBP-type peptidyl-prolyl cis-trans isomerase N-terminal domain-containing protein [Luteimonas sp.]|uniref:FKBP-type peptidyl-prolyl cis-trans isomerase N-terminal domain-containing protein n=1 Tax=Cognatiluteimonas lumbrici TaxID=2559601 RepID=UPI00112656FE|nr:FKBP-type peptidyl-prolyl cis-trans isomerase N-terminal domain-containing protein [Luteimonas lumbrici]HLT43949.1 FKBP-type peptidyl-prolyl cis-trans isomerase N-terminal domain-containing protein [Luteimonas sp.]